MLASRPEPRRRRMPTARRLRGALLWLMGFAGAFVFIEPSPYEIVVAARDRALRAHRADAAAGAGAARPAADPSQHRLRDRRAAGARPGQRRDLGAGLVAIWRRPRCSMPRCSAPTRRRGSICLMRGYLLAARRRRRSSPSSAYFHLFGGALRPVPALRPRARHLQRSERARRLPGAARPAGAAAHARRPAAQVPAAAPCCLP